MSITQRGQSAWMRHQVVQDKMWRIVDAKDQVLGRLASQIARILQGKHKAMYMSNMDCGDPVVVINARHFTLTGRKRYTKHYTHHTGYPGGLRQVPIEQVMKRRPKDALVLAVKRMLPRNKLRDVWLSNMRVFLDAEHDHEAQAPVPLPREHLTPRVGKGGPPSYAEMEKWWVDQLMCVSDDTMKEVLEEVRAETRNETTVEGSVGLAQLLEVPRESTMTGVARTALEKYAAAADDALRNGAVIVPKAFA